MSKPSISTISLIDAISGFLKALFPHCKTYSNPNQQDTEIPCWFIEVAPLSGIKQDTVGERFKRMLHIDLAYLEDYNLEDLYDRYLVVADILDEKLELFNYPYTDENGVEKIAYIRTSDREWKIDASTLHYRFKLQLRAGQIKEKEVIMKEIEQVQIVGKEG